MDRSSAASVDWEALAHHFADELVERWHRPDSAHALPLAQFMGLSDAQYAAWVECRFDAVLAGADDACAQGHPWLLTEEAKTISNVLIDVWDDAEANGDEATVRKVKAALDYLQLPWVRL